MRKGKLALSIVGVLAGSAVGVAARGEGPDLKFPVMLPGQYEETIQFISHSDNAPPDLAVRFGDKTPRVKKFCFERQQGDRPVPSLIEIRAGRGCVPVSAELTGDRTKGKFSCDGSRSSGSLEFDGTYTATSADLVTVVTISLPEQSKPLMVSSRHTIRRVAESCAGG